MFKQRADSNQYQLKTKVHTPKGKEILRKAERMLMNERVRNINNTIIMLNCQADTCIKQLKSILTKMSWRNALNSSTKQEKEDTEDHDETNKEI